jgi:ABC-type polysaccharide/polyol phosphate transport system ATPase subunit
MAKLHLDNVSVQYPIYNATSMSLRNQLIAISTGGLMARGANSIVTVRALEDVTLNLKDGDRVGLLGHNGSGKTTLLRTMAGIFKPNTGKITVEGRISAIFGLGAGIEPEMSGHENIIRMSMLLGASYAEAKARIPEIEDFTELGNFLALPVRTYSAGMQTRLTFAVATAAQPEILLMDEVIGTGDADFQAKARKRMNDFIEKSSVFVLASHSQELIQSFCNMVCTLEHGRIINEGTVSAMRAVQSIVA